jgi:hypothetical protein
LLEFLRGLDKESDIVQALVKRREICIRAVEKAAEYEKQLAGCNMETMILKGIRNPCINRDEMKKTIEIIDTIRLSIFSGSDSLPCSLHPVSKI